MIEIDYDEFQDIMSHSASWIQSELGEKLAEILLEEMHAE